jgi:hypothetical protein
MRTRRRSTRKKGKPRGRTGRRPTGLHGEKVSIDYPVFTMRLPPATVEAMRRLSADQGRPMWRIVVDAIDAYVAGTPEAS